MGYGPQPGGLMDISEHNEESENTSPIITTSELLSQKDSEGPQFHLHEVKKQHSQPLGNALAFTAQVLGGFEDEEASGGNPQ